MDIRQEDITRSQTELHYSKRPEKEVQRLKIAEDTAKFLAGGGAIEDTTGTVRTADQIAIMVAAQTYSMSNNRVNVQKERSRIATSKSNREKKMHREAIDKVNAEIK